MNTKREPIRAHQKRSVTRAFGQNTEGSTDGRQRRLANLNPPWPKGVSGNPGGRPRKRAITEAHLEVATQKVANDPRGRTYAQVAAERQFRAALRGSTSAIREIADRLEGKPRQSIEMTHQEDFLAGRTTEEKEFFAVHGYWPDETDADGDRQARHEHDEGCSDVVGVTQLIKVG